LHTKKLPFTPEGQKDRHKLGDFTPVAERPIVAKVKANPPTKRKSQFEDYGLTTPKKVIRPQALGILTPYSDKEQYRPGNVKRRRSTEVNTSFDRQLETITETNNIGYRTPLARDFSSEGSSPDLDLFHDAEPFRELAALIRRQVEQPSPDQDQLREEIDIIADFDAALDLDDSDYEAELLLLDNLDNPPIQEPVGHQVVQEPIMAAPPNDLPGIIQHLQGENNVERQNAIVQLAQYVQRINAPAQAQQAPERITLRQALENQREGAANNLKVTDLMPDPWGSTKDGDPESHCLRFESYANVHGYADDQSKIIWFQATLKGDALNWLTAENNYRTWADLRRAFIAEFENQPSRNVAIGNFRNLSWNGTERASTYLQRLKKAARIIEADDAEIMVQFEIGLPKAVKLFFGATNPTSLKDMTQTLQKYLELHGPVTLSSTGASQALTTIAEVLTGSNNNPFMQNNLYSHTLARNPNANSEDTATALRYMAQQNSLLTTMVAGEKEGHQNNTDRSRRPERDKSVRFEENPRKYKSPSRKYRQTYSSAESDGSAPENTDNEADSDHEGKYTRNKHGDSNKRYHKYRDQKDNRHSQGSRGDKRYDTYDHMRQMMPVVAAMADLTQRGRYDSPRESYERQAPAGQQQNEYPRGDSYSQNNYRGNGYDSRGRGRGRGYQAGNSRNSPSTVPPGDGTCYYCGNYGHFKRECRKFSYDNRNRQTRPGYGGNRNQSPQDARRSNQGNFT
jgi:hypothetical protein